MSPEGRENIAKAARQALSDPEVRARRTAHALKLTEARSAACSARMDPKQMRRPGVLPYLVDPWEIKLGFPELFGGVRK